MFNYCRFLKWNVLLIVINLVSTTSFAQGFWSHYDENDGLLKNELSDVLIEDAQNIWLASTFGLVKFNAITETFGPSYTNGTIISQNISQLEYANNRVWLLTDIGVTSIQGNVITNYNRSNGLLSNDVRDLAVDTSGQLWIASPSSVSYFDGNAFVHDTTVSAYHIEIDNSNNVFVIDQSYNILFNNNGPFLTHRVFDGTSWTQPAVTGLGNNPIALYNIRFKKTKEGVFLLSRDFDGGFYKLSYPFHLDSVSTQWQEYENISNQIFRVNDFTVTPSGKTWVIGSPEMGVFSSDDSLLQPHILNPQYEHFSPFSGANEVIESNDSLIIICSSNGIYVGNSTILPNQLNEELSVNSIRTIVNAYSSLFNDFLRNESDFEVPKGSNRNVISLGSFFQSSSKVNDPFFETNFINPFQRNYAIGPVNKRAGIEGDWLVKITKEEIDLHVASLNRRGYVPSDKITYWFAKGNNTLGVYDDLAPFFDANGDGCYDALGGDYPSIKGDEAIYWINHIGKFEYHGMLYGYYDSLNTLTNQSIFLDYTIINRDTVKYDSIKVGLLIDFDLGFTRDDYIGCDSSKNTFYGYNGDTFDDNPNTSGYGNAPPAVGVRFLSDTMAGFVNYHLGTGATGQPVSSQEVHRYLNSRWTDGVPIYYGGNGRDNTNLSPVKYMYSGNPFTQTGWTELDPGQGLQPNPSGDRNGLGHIPYFNLNLNERKTISVAIGYGQNDSISQVGENISEMMNVLDNAELIWNSTRSISGTLSDTSCSIITTIDDVRNQKTTELFKIYPNPTSNYFTIEFETKTSNFPLRIFNTKGQLIQEYQNLFSGMQINIEELMRGIYLIQYNNSTKKLMVLD